MQDGFKHSLSWHLFSTLDGLTRLGKPIRQLLVAGPPKPSIWLFLSTIGEMNAISGFLSRLAMAIPPQHWVILTDRKIYREAYLKRYPTAQVAEISDDPREAYQLAASYPPTLFLVSEIPLQPSDAPCRLPYAWVHAAERAGAPRLLVNGWPYRYQPSCRADALERKLLGRAWLRAFDLICVQDEAGSRFALEHGAQPQSVHICGNMKFDALAISPDAITTDQRGLAIWLQQTNRPTIVAGSVTDASEQALVFAAFAKIHRQSPTIRLLLAPRHPENPAVLHHIAQQCAEHGLGYQLRSEMLTSGKDSTADCLVLDTIGELRDAFRFGACSHIGKDHNLLEPLCAGLDVTALPNWDATYPSFPVFKVLSEAGDVSLHTDADSLARRWQHSLEQYQQQNRQSKVSELLARFGGATERSWQLASDYINQAQASLANQPNTSVPGSLGASSQQNASLH
ncbi:3-deoxy-D-manno-octulosonic acid transferase [Chitinimonas sp. PSY-7]|uniref:glycosyltransferase N-terminal domain-containing protein n=1 Tax=Chitinimonas sp. PSY-7 TaxID=3459088 RepID=UPI00403FCFA1